MRLISTEKNLFVCLCLPNFHLLDTYVKDHRVDTLVQGGDVTTLTADATGTSITAAEVCNSSIILQSPNDREGTATTTLPSTVVTTTGTQTRNLMTSGALILHVSGNFSAFLMLVPFLRRKP